MNPSPNLDISQDVLGNLSETMGLTSLALSLALESVDNLKANMIIAALYTLFVGKSQRRQSRRMIDEHMLSQGLFTPLTALAAYVLLCVQRIWPSLHQVVDPMQFQRHRTQDK